MNFSRVFRYLVIILLPLICQPAFGVEQDQLSFEDVHRIMDDILAQHVDQKSVTTDVLKNSFLMYIEQFDPEKIYLFKAEVDHFMDMNESDLDLILRDYQNHRYRKYEELNNMIQNAILRARKYRQEIIANADQIFQRSSTDSKVIDLFGEDRKRPYAADVAELKKRIEQEIVQFISEERTKYGDRPVIENKAKTLRTYTRLMENSENKYLFVDDEGRILSQKERENLLVLHVLKALARSLDSHTSFLDSSEAYDMKVRLEKGFKGIGVVLKKNPEGIVIARMVEGGPAEKSGIVKLNDRISEINGHNVDGASLEELVDKLRDDTEDPVRLVLKRQIIGKPGEVRTIPVSLQREMITVDEGRVDTDFVKTENGIIGKLTLYSFYQGENGVTSEKDIRKAIKDLEKEGRLEGLVLDLRENSGGFLNQAVKVAGLFITNGVVVISKYSDGEKRYYRDMDGKTVFDGPLVVLTSKATASAAEIVAQALQDYGVAVVVGDEQTYGKGTIQSQTVTDGRASSHFKVTVGKYYTVSGKTPQMRGVKADIVVPSHYKDELIGEEFTEYPIAADTIDPAYADVLSDVEPGLKPWYLRYYMPTLQKQEKIWSSLVPNLQKESKKRLAMDQKFQSYLNAGFDLSALSGLEEKSKDDPQMDEAVNIVKDMIRMEGTLHKSKVAEY